MTRVLYLPDIQTLIYNVCRIYSLQEGKMGKIAIVTDSTSDLPPGLASENDINIIPLSVVFEGTEYIDDRESIKLKDFYGKLKDSSEMPMAAQPSPGDFLKLYSNLLKDHEGIISIHISSKLSGTYNSASLAKKQLGSPGINVIDSEMVHMACGFMAMEASRLVSKGMDIEDVLKGISSFRERIGSLFCPFTLDNLIKGGRMGKLKGVFANMLDVKPMLTLKDGEVSLYRKARKWEQAKDTIISAIKEETSGSDSVAISVGDVDAENEADYVCKRIMDEIEPRELIRNEVGIVVGSHLGIGGLGITYHT
jgi:DegV family protein with EDD domain